MTEPSTLTLCAYCKETHGTCNCPVKCKVKLLRDQNTCRKCDCTDAQIAFGDPLHACRLAYACPVCLVYTCEDCHSDSCTYCNSGKTLKIFYTSFIPFDHDKSILPHCDKLFKAAFTNFMTYHKTMTLINEYIHWIKTRARNPEVGEAPSVKINKLWMCHIIDTMSYAKFCEKACGMFIHHDPTQYASRQSGIEVGMMLASRRDVSCIAMKLWGMKYSPVCPTIKVNVLVDSKVYEITTQLDTLISSFCAQVRDVANTAVKVKFNGLFALPRRTLEYYGVESGSTIKVVSTR